MRQGLEQVAAMPQSSINRGTPREIHEPLIAYHSSSVGSAPMKNADLSNRFFMVFLQVGKRKVGDVLSVKQQPPWARQVIHKGFEVPTLTLDRLECTLPFQN